MKKYLLSIGLISGLLLAGCTNTTEEAEKEIDKPSVSEEVEKGTDKETDKGTDKGTDKDTDKGISDEALSEHDIVVEGFGSLQSALNKNFNYDEEQFKQVISLYGKDNYNYETFIPGESEKISFYKDKSVIHGEEKSQAEDTYLIYIFSPTCVYCNEFYDTLVDYTKKDNAYSLYKLNVDILENYFAWEDYNVSGTPTLVLYDKANDKVLNSFAGVQELEKLPVIE